MTLKDKVAIVTGSGGGGTGRATACPRLSREGALVVVTDLNQSGGHETVSRIESEGGRAAFCLADVGKEPEIRALFDFAESRFGGVNVLVNNASSPDGFGQLTGWVESIQTELLGPMRATLLAIEAMRRRGGGAIVNIGSTSAIGHGRKHSRWPSYDAGKMAVMRLTTTLGPLRDQENIRVNCLVPSWVASPGPKEYWGKPHAGAAAKNAESPKRSSSLMRSQTPSFASPRMSRSSAGSWCGGTANPPRLIPVGDPGYQRLE